MQHSLNKIFKKNVYLILLALPLLLFNACKKSTNPVGKIYTNKALQFDGIDDKIDIFLIPITNQWSLSAWVKGNDSLWNTNESIISNGWATIETWETTPLSIINGYPSIGDSLISSHKLDSKWHHLAVVNDGTNYKLYVDGELEATGKGGKSICPSFIGAKDSEDFFNGTLDEIRIWDIAIDQETIKNWMHKPLRTNHKYYSNLLASYSFDDEALDATDISGRYHGDIKKHYSSTATNNTPVYINNSNDLFKDGYTSSDYIQTKQYKSNYDGLTNTPKDNTLKVLSWNIWHGGVENGEALGRQRVIDIIKASTADVVLMVETYGAAKVIAEQLGFEYYTLGEKDNLAIFSRFPIIEQYPSKFKSFFSIGAKIKMPNNTEVVVWDVWLRYALPDYTMEINNPQHTEQDMIDGDLNYAVKDIDSILKKDLTFYVNDEKTPIIFGGDFNSCSHLDWTTETVKAGLHYNKAVEFPVSKIMMNHDYKDSYREIHPNPVTHIGKTWSPLYNYCEDFRIDFIYYKGSKVKPIDSRVIDRHPDQNQMFPSDHAGVLTVFEIN